ncbi:HipA domain-containing protein [Methylophaga lonarensis]|uniref:HipA domain-containing protein n=1 Tax=Methylophaga lonarensis TaxID=999151 RepID=UPI003D2AA7E0
MVSLPITFNDEPVGTIGVRDDEFFVEYDERWLQTGFALSPHIPLDGSARPLSIEYFLSNLFPEGDQLDVLLRSMQIRKSNVMAILSAIGMDAPGAMAYGAEHVGENHLRRVTSEELVAKLDSGDPAQILVWDGRYRLSLAGVQMKLNIVLAEDNFFLADGCLASTHLLKFANPQHRYLIVNEFVCMRLAQAVGLEVAEVECLQFGAHRSLMVRRFDRELADGTPTGQQRRLHVIDGCQLLDLPPQYKYEQIHGVGRDVRHIRDGASIPLLFEAINQSLIPAKARIQLLDMILFNLIIGNSDAHGKNVSFRVDRAGVQMAPLYDLVSVCFEARQIPDIDDNLAMAIGDEFDADKITAYHLITMADEVGIDRNLLKRRLALMCGKVKKLAGLLSFDSLTEAEQDYAKALIVFILKRNDWFEQQVAEFKPVIASL